MEGRVCVLEQESVQSLSFCLEAEAVLLVEEEDAHVPSPVAVQDPVSQSIHQSFDLRAAVSRSNPIFLPWQPHLLPLRVKDVWSPKLKSSPMRT